LLLFQVFGAFSDEHPSRHAVDVMKIVDVLL
jgi:hypothetical protein